MEILVPVLISFFTALLTFFSGFGLGTLLMPALAFFFPVEMAVALTGVVHFFNNLFKLLLVGKKANRQILIQFGVPAVLFSFAGAWLLVQMTEWPSFYDYTVYGHTFFITPIKSIIAVLLLFFTILDVIPVLKTQGTGYAVLGLGGA
ncbi:MAG: TSUP family transporter, partial [Cyclobacteriaceae bacterium]|nr:TSUP family transporter [Cyclobacteriaceae bacterium]